MSTFGHSQGVCVEAVGGAVSAQHLQAKAQPLLLWLVPAGGIHPGMLAARSGAF